MMLIDLKLHADDSAEHPAGPSLMPSPHSCWLIAEGNPNGQHERSGEDGRHKTDKFQNTKHPKSRGVRNTRKGEGIGKAPELEDTTDGVTPGHYATGRPEDGMSGSARRPIGARSISARLTTDPIA